MIGIVGLGRLCGLASSAAISAVLIASPAAAQQLSERQAIDLALAQGDFAALGEAERAAAEARVGTIARLENPELSVSREQVSGSGDREIEYQVGVTQPVSISGQRSSLRAATRAEAAAVVADVGRRRQERIAATREAYTSCAAAGEKLSVLRDFAARLREAERTVTLRTRAGDTAGYDLRRLRLEGSSAASQLRLAEGEQQAQCVTLARLTGQANARPTSSTRELLPTPSAAANQAASVTRLDLVARERRVEAAAAESDAARRARLPDLSVGLGYKRISNDAGSAGGPTVGLGVRLPLFNRGGAALTEARARQRQREAELALSRREVEAAVAAASARAAGAVAAAREAQTTAEDARRLSQIAEAAYQGGEGGVVELVDAYRTARDARLAVVDLTERAVLATISTNLAEGRDQ